MSGDSFQAQRADWIRAPRAGQISVFSTSTAAATVDLRTIGNQQLASLPAGNSPLGNFVVNQPRKGLVGHYVRFEALGADCYVAFGNTSASVGSISAAATGSNAANACLCIPAGTYQDFLIEEDPADQSLAALGPSTWLGYVTASGTGTLVIAQTSP